MNICYNAIMRMNSPIGKQILALVREKDHAHAGEEEAIDLIFEGIPKDPNRLLLDVGCGRGGTAHYIQSKGWGRVLGVDIDSDSIEYARKVYPEIEFSVADVLLLSETLSKRFDLIYLLNSFYAFLDQPGALSQLCEISSDKGQLIVFDYVINAGSRESFPFSDWNPLDLSIVRDLFSSSNWHITDVKDISELYAKWYRDLVLRIEMKAGEIIDLASEEWFVFVRTFYHNVLASIEKGLLGGAIVYAATS